MGSWFSSHPKPPKVDIGQSFQLTLEQAIKYSDALRAQYARVKGKEASQMLHEKRELLDDLVAYIHAEIEALNKKVSQRLTDIIDGTVVALLDEVE